MWLLPYALSVALAEAPVVRVTSTGAVEGTVELGVDAQRVRDLLASPGALSEALGGEATVTSVPDGDCARVTTFAPHPIKSVTYTVRTCPTELGVVSTLIESQDLSRFDALWEVQPTDGGVEVRYQLDVQPSFPLPAFIARSSAKKGVLDALEGLARTFAASTSPGSDPAPASPRP